MLKKDVTKTQNTILFQLYKFRFLHTYHIQTLLNHKNHTRINTWLNNLTKNEYVTRYYDKQTISKKPAVYTLTKKARKLLKSNKHCTPKILNKIYREKQRSQMFINHCLLVADVYVALRTRQKKDEIITFETKNTLTDYDYFPQATLDAYVAIKTPQNVNRSFITIIDTTTRFYILKGIVRQYLTYWQSDAWQENTNKPFPSVLLICSDEKIKHSITRYIAKTLHEEQVDIHFHIATYAQVQKKELLFSV